MSGSSQQQAPALSFAGRIVRGTGFDRNPLRRVTDRIETVVVTVLVVAFLVAAPLAALVAGGWAHAAAQRAESGQQATRREVSATLLPGPSSRAADNSAMVTWADAARWMAPDGRTTTVDLPIAVETRGLPATLPVWTTLNGQLVPPPLNGAQVTWLTVLAAALGIITTAVTLFLSSLTARLLLNRHRMAAWDADWRTTGPRWSTLS
jgi:hypothetical protein